MRKKLSVDQIVRRAAGRLDAREQAQLDAALAADAELARAAREQSAVWHALDDWEGEPVSPDFDARLSARIEALPAATWRSGLAALLPPLRWGPALPLGLATLALVSGLLLSHVRKTPAAAPAVEAVSARDADQIETTLDDLQTLHQLYADGAASQI